MQGYERVDKLVSILEEEAMQEHIEHLQNGGILVLAPGRDGETALIMEHAIAEEAIQIRYPAPHSPQWIGYTEAAGLLEAYRGDVTEYA